MREPIDPMDEILREARTMALGGDVEIHLDFPDDMRAAVGACLARDGFEATLTGALYEILHSIAAGGGARVEFVVMPQFRRPDGRLFRIPADQDFVFALDDDVAA